MKTAEYENLIIVDHIMKSVGETMRQHSPYLAMHRTARIWEIRLGLRREANSQTHAPLRIRASTVARSSPAPGSAR